MDYISHVLEWFGGGVLAVFAFLFFGVGVAVFGLADEFGGAKKFALGVLGIALIAGLFFACLGTGAYIAKSIDAPGVLGLAAGGLAFLGAANLADHLIKRRKASTQKPDQNR